MSHAAARGKPGFLLRLRELLRQLRKEGRDGPEILVAAFRLNEEAGNPLADEDVVAEFAGGWPALAERWRQPAALPSPTFQLILADVDPPPSPVSAEVLLTVGRQLHKRGVEPPRISGLLAFLAARDGLTVPGGVASIVRQLPGCADFDPWAAWQREFADSDRQAEVAGLELDPVEEPTAPSQTPQDASDGPRPEQAPACEDPSVRRGFKEQPPMKYPHRRGEPHRPSLLAELLDQLRAAGLDPQDLTEALTDFRQPTPLTASPDVRAVLARARDRFQRLAPGQRPRLLTPTSAVGLFPKSDLLLLGLAGWWPLPRRALAWIERPPVEQSRRRRARAEQLVPVLLKLLAPQLGLLLRSVQTNRARRNGR